VSSSCLADVLLLDVAEGRRSLDGAVERHLAICTDCRRVLAAAARGAGARAGMPSDPAGDTLRDSGSEPASEPSWDELGAGVVVADRYVLERFLGAGGMGVVWAARRAEDGEHVALKIARGTDPDLLRRFEREARILAALEHPNIIRTLEVLPATPSRGVVLVLPLLDGESLEARLSREGRLSLRDAARIVVPIAHALVAAHAQGIVHRDLKPQNVFLRDDSRVTVLDFGIAKLTPEWGSHSKLTRTGMVLGTPSYMAPEQIFGEREIDARADIWALGALSFRALAGSGPVRGTALGDIVRELGNGNVEDLAALVPGLPPDILDVIRRALVIPREHRLGDVSAFARVLSPHWSV
jgi:serine/threonine-protein kinase